MVPDLDRGVPVDVDHAVEIADRVWWVGHVLADDHFQCHAYLLENGHDSVLFDPGGRLTFEHVRRKVEEIVPFSDIRWIVCHHQDPDIAGSLPILDELITRTDAAVITHWRAAALLRHYDLRLPFWLIDEHDWHLDVGGRDLRFVFTPYLHFPGAFVTFDEMTGTLFSSDLFGGFTEEWTLFATDVSYFESMRPFHEHYMPSREILTHGLEAIEQLPVRLIAPQHGELIPEELIAPIIKKLKSLDCGLYLLVGHDTDIRRLSVMNDLLGKTIRQLMVSRDFGEVANALMETARTVFPTRLLEFYGRDPDGVMLRFGPDNRYHGTPAALPEEWVGLLEVPRGDDGGEVPVRVVEHPERALLIALFSPMSPHATGLGVLHLDARIKLHETALVALSQLGAPLEVALEREMLLRSVETQRQRFYDMAMHDPLTGLLNRSALLDPLRRMFALQDRGDTSAVVVTMFDIDHFKAINDRYGHPAGDVVLGRIAQAIGENVRAGDLAIRMGGEEFAVVTTNNPSSPPDVLAEHVRDSVQKLRFSGEERDLRVTMSAGVAVRLDEEPTGPFFARADQALYVAKESGRDRVVVAGASLPQA